MTLASLMHSPPRAIVLAMLAIVVTIYVAHIVPRGIGAQMRRVPHADPNLDLLVRRFTAWVIWAIGLAFAATALGFGLAGAVTAGGATVVLGLACQNYLTNMIDGTALLTERDFEIGDVIQLPALGDLTGTVVDMRVRRTKLVNADGKNVIVPNSSLFTNPIIVTSAPKEYVVCATETTTTQSSPSLRLSRSSPGPSPDERLPDHQSPSD